MMDTAAQRIIQYLYGTDAPMSEMRDAIIGNKETSTQFRIWCAWKDYDNAMITSYFMASGHREYDIMERMVFYMALCGWSPTVCEYIHRRAEEYQALELCLDDAIALYGKQWRMFLMSQHNEQERLLDETVNEVSRLRSQERSECVLPLPISEQLALF